MGIPVNWHWNDKYIKLPCVYVVYMVNYLTDRHLLLYIGTTKNLYARMSTHVIYKRKLQHPYVMRLKVKIIKRGRLDLEERLIKRLQPILNKNFK